MFDDDPGRANPVGFVDEIRFDVFIDRKDGTGKVIKELGVRPEPKTM